MREVFKAKASTPESIVFYTITAEDYGKRIIHAEVGAIPVQDILGIVMWSDIGRRLYWKPNNAGDTWVWVAETDRQRRHRLEDNS